MSVQQKPKIALSFTYLHVFMFNSQEKKKNQHECEAFQRTDGIVHGKAGFLFPPRIVAGPDRLKSLADNYYLFQFHLN